MTSTVRTRILLAALALGGLAACGGGDGDGAASAATNPSATEADPSRSSDTSDAPDHDAPDAEPVSFDDPGEAMCGVLTDAEVAELTGRPVEPLFVQDTFSGVQCQWFADVDDDVDIAASFQIDATLTFAQALEMNLGLLDDAEAIEVGGRPAWASPAQDDIIDPDATVGVALAGDSGPSFVVNADDVDTAVAIADAALDEVLALVS